MLSSRVYSAEKQTSRTNIQSIVRHSRSRLDRTENCTRQRPGSLSSKSERTLWPFAPRTCDTAHNQPVQAKAGTCTGHAARRIDRIQCNGQSRKKDGFNRKSHQSRFAQTSRTAPALYNPFTSRSAFGSGTFVSPANVHSDCSKDRAPQRSHSGPDMGPSKFRTPKIRLQQPRQTRNQQETYCCSGQGHNLGVAGNSQINCQNKPCDRVQREAGSRHQEIIRAHCEKSQFTKLAYTACTQTLSYFMALRGQGSDRGNFRVNRDGYKNRQTDIPARIAGLSGKRGSKPLQKRQYCEQARKTASSSEYFIQPLKRELTMFINNLKMVVGTGLEPATSSMSTKRSTN